MTFESNGSGSPATNARDACCRIDQLRALLRVRLRQQPFRRTLHERRIGVVAVAIRVRELHRLDDRVEVVGAVVLHRLQIELLEDVERLEQHRTLAAERLLVDVVAAIGRRRRLFDLGEELGEVVELERRLVLLQERDHLARDVAFVEAIARRDDARRAALACAPRSASTIRFSVRARSGSLIVSPAL